jgi:hypothetical protein
MVSHHINFCLSKSHHHANFCLYNSPTPPTLTVSTQVERCWMVTRSGKQLELQPRVDDCAITHPTFALSNSDRQVNTRSTTGSSRNKPLTEVTVLYNLCNEPWMKYSMSSIADRGLKSSQWTSSRLREECLYLETSRWAVTVSIPDSPAASWCCTRGGVFCTGVGVFRLGC